MRKYVCVICEHGRKNHIDGECWDCSYEFGPATFVKHEFKQDNLIYIEALAKERKLI